MSLMMMMMQSLILIIWGGNCVGMRGLLFIMAVRLH